MFSDSGENIGDRERKGSTVEQVEKAQRVNGAARLHWKGGDGKKVLLLETVEKNSQMKKVRLSWMKVDTRGTGRKALDKVEKKESVIDHKSPPTTTRTIRL